MNKLMMIFVAVFIIGVTGALLYRNNGQKTQPPQQESSETSVNFTASFEIVTNDTKRIFTQAMYHNQSADVYIENSNPSVIYVKKAKVTWDEFFKTLPFSVTKDCLITGTKQTFCSNESKKLRFFLNEVESPDALDYEIKENDELKISY